MHVFLLEPSFLNFLYGINLIFKKITFENDKENPPKDLVLFRKYKTFFGKKVYLYITETAFNENMDFMECNGFNNYIISLDKKMRDILKLTLCKGEAK